MPHLVHLYLAYSYSLLCGSLVSVRMAKNKMVEGKTLLRRCHMHAQRYIPLDVVATTGWAYVWISPLSLAG